MSAASLPLSYRISRGLVLPAVLVLAWETAGRAGGVDARFLPPLAVVGNTAWSELASGDLWRNVSASLMRDVAGFLAGSAAGFLFGLLLACSRLADRTIGPTFHGLKQIAVFAWIPLISMWFGVGEAAKVAFIALVAFTPVTLNTYEGVRSVSVQYIEVARVFTFTRWNLLRKVILPSALPSICTGIHLALIYAWLATIGAEYFMTLGPGIGGMMTEGRERFLMDIVLLGVGLLGLIGFALNQGAGLLETRLLRWRQA